jgi:UDP-N-acetylglucosamine:LPS N-acetylglucosamine transferase
MPAYKKLCLVASIGGHLQEILELACIYDKVDHFFVVNEPFELPAHMRGRTYLIRHSERDLLAIWNLWEAWRILRRERPTHLISTGAGLAVPLSLVARLQGIRVLYIESFCAIHRPTLTGRFMYYIAHQFFYQWKYLEAVFPKAVYAGKIFDLRNGRNSQTAVPPLCQSGR